MSLLVKCLKGSLTVTFPVVWIHYYMTLLYFCGVMSVICFCSCIIKWTQYLSVCPCRFSSCWSSVSFLCLRVQNIQQQTQKQWTLFLSFCSVCRSFRVPPLWDIMREERPTRSLWLKRERESLYLKNINEPFILKETPSCWHKLWRKENYLAINKYIQKWINVAKNVEIIFKK